MLKVYRTIWYILSNVYILYGHYKSTMVFFVCFLVHYVMPRVIFDGMLTNLSMPYTSGWSVIKVVIIQIVLVWTTIMPIQSWWMSGLRYMFFHIRTRLVKLNITSGLNPEHLPHLSPGHHHKGPFHDSHLVRHMQHSRQPFSPKIIGCFQMVYC